MEIKNIQDILEIPVLEIEIVKPKSTYYQRNKEQKLKYQREYAKNNPDKIKTKYLKNREKYLAYTKQYLIEHPPDKEKTKQYGRDYMKKYYREKAVHKICECGAKIMSLNYGHFKTNKHINALNKLHAEKLLNVTN